MGTFYYQVQNEFIKLYFLEEPCDVTFSKDREKLQLIGEVELLWEVNDSYLEEGIEFALECAVPSLRSRLPFAAQQVGSDKVIKGR